MTCHMWRIGEWCVVRSLRSASSVGERLGDKVGPLPDSPHPPTKLNIYNQSPSQCGGRVRGQLQLHGAPFLLKLNGGGQKLGAPYKMKLWRLLAG